MTALATTRISFAAAARTPSTAPVAFSAASAAFRASAAACLLAEVTPFVSALRTFVAERRSFPLTLSASTLSVSSISSSLCRTGSISDAALDGGGLLGRCCSIIVSRPDRLRVSLLCFSMSLLIAAVNPATGSSTRLWRAVNSRNRSKFSALVCADWSSVFMSLSNGIASLLRPVLAVVLEDLVSALRAEVGGERLAGLRQELPVLVSHFVAVFIALGHAELHVVLSQHGLVRLTVGRARITQ
ncbi:hypothetical protein ATN37_09055 [Rhodococcus sp. MH15]|uniref:hypothetical protein n=1 Tax=Rhodococcus sp. MH15 TaxID=1761014 RepID=UPI001D24DBF4|nr:hypothetical protein [Rhodococcus sp. MH15]MBW0291836.1 hypothetical protein [Rhodococcus sp. MH15]